MKQMGDTTLSAKGTIHVPLGRSGGMVSQKIFKLSQALK